MSMRRRSGRFGKKFRYGASAALITALFVAAVVLFNGVFSLLADRFRWYADMTGEAVFTLSDAAKEYVAGIDKKIDVYFASDPDTLMEDEDMRYVYTTARELEDAVDGVRVECVNVVKNPGFFKEFYSTSATDVTSRSVVVRSGTESRVLTPQSFFVYNEDGKRWGYQGEYRFISSIMQVTETESPEVVFTTGHGEDIEGASTLAQLFWDCGFEVKVSDLSEENVGEDCRIIVIYNPVYDFLGAEAEDSSKNEITKLDRMLDGLGGLLVFEDPGHVSNLVNLNEFLKEWGISYRADVKVRDLSHSLSTDGYSVFAEYGDANTLGGSFITELTELYSSPKAVIRESGPVDILWESGGDLSGSRTVSAMLRSYPGAELTGEDGVIEKGTYNLLTMSLETRIIDNNRYYSYVVAAGSPTFGSNNYLVSNAYGNRDIIYTTMKWVGRNGILADLDMKPFDDTTLTLSTAEANGHAAWMTLALPAALAVCGVVVLVRRKHA